MDDGLVDQWPEMLGALEFRTVGRQEDEGDSVGGGQAFGAVPVGVVEHEADVALAPGWRTWWIRGIRWCASRG